MESENTIPHGLDTVAGCYRVLKALAADFEGHREGNNKEKLSQAARDWYHAASFLLRAYTLKKNWPNGFDGVPIEAIPPEFAAVFADQLQYISVGNIPAPIELARKKGYEPGPDYRRDLGIAAAYLNAVKDGIVLDRAPIKTVTHHFGASRRAVFRWQSEYAFARAEMFFENTASAELGTAIFEAMKEAGSRYKSGSRAVVAFSARASKRRKG
jgi:hypothetical protein